MKKSRISIVFIVSILAAVLLSSCAGGTAYNSWAGVSAKDGVVYLAYLNGVFAVKDGAMLWRFPEKAENGKYFFSAPAFTQDVVIAGDYANQVFGINPQNGSQSWSFSQEGAHFVASPLVVEDTILAPASNHNLYAMDLSGKLRWQFRTGNILWAQPASDGTTVFLPAMDHTLYALKLSDGSLAWKKDLGSALPSAPQLVEGKALYVTTLDGKITALDPANGNVLWEAQVDGNVWSAPVLVGDTLFVGSSNNKVYLVSVGEVTGSRVLKETDLGSPVIGGGVLFGENVVFATEGGSLFALDSTGQTTQWKPTVNGKLYTTPVVVGEQVVVAVKDGDKLLAAFDQNGTEVWSFTAPK